MCFPSPDNLTSRFRTKYRKKTPSILTTILLSKSIISQIYNSLALSLAPLSVVLSPGHPERVRPSIVCARARERDRVRTFSRSLGQVVSRRRPPARENLQRKSENRASESEKHTLLHHPFFLQICNHRGTVSMPTSVSVSVS